MTDAMKANLMLMTLVAAVLSSMSLCAQDMRSYPPYDTERYEGQWPKGEGILYSYDKGLVVGTFDKEDRKDVAYATSRTAKSIGVNSRKARPRARAVSTGTTAL